jgi:hypothetical protein
VYRNREGDDDAAEKSFALAAPHRVLIGTAEPIWSEDSALPGASQLPVRDPEPAFLTGGQVADKKRLELFSRRRNPL